jgi:type I restriction-modification system DNA methylase subunit/predicted type IV restriction endonuclease
MTTPQKCGTIGNDSGRPLAEEAAVSAEEDRTQVRAPEKARRDIEELVQRFARNRDVYTRPDYKETQVRVEFIDPFFEALGWDVRNVQGYAEAYKDVIHEDAIKVSGATKAPDYSFRVGGVRKFFLEAKKPSTAVKGDVGPAYQLRRYVWSSHLPLGILTDFEEFAVYDCRRRPQPADKASVERVMYLTFDEYLDRLDDIYTIFARESVLKGSFDRYVEDTKRKRGTSEVDVEFLKEIEGWRDELARNLALRNADLSVHELNFAVQRTIDRIIFLRMCEDRGIEGYGRLLGLTGGPHIYERLGELYREADERYNSDLFDFQADTLTRSLSIDDKTLKPILSGLYYPDSPYEFSVLPAEILGQVYEQFLGKVIRLTPGHRAKVEEKPEVKKAGGVYYTPSYIVDYIVEQTVGRLIEGKTPKHISRLRFLDPACGSGSFLLGAYQRLLDYHRQWYEEHDPEKEARSKRPAIRQGRGGEWRLTTGEKKRILLNNVYGVDIDRQAVEVTKLSLLLKVLEGENQETLGQQLRLWRERALPDLGENVKCGNSLIGPDYFQGQLIPDEEEMRRVNPFDWEKEFPKTMKAGGFDAVIGNPPYVRIQTMKDWAPTEVEFYKDEYVSASRGNYDIYVVFVERALQLLNEKGRMGYILPHKFFQSQYGESLRTLIAEGKHLGEIVHFGAEQVFAGATTYTCLLFLDKGGNPSFRYLKAHDLAAWRANRQTVEGEISAGKAGSEQWNFVVGPGVSVLERIEAIPLKLGDIAELFVGLQTDADSVYILEEIAREGPVVTCRSEATGLNHQFENDHLKHLLKGSVNIRRYRLSGLTKRLIFPYETRQGQSALLSATEYQERYPMTWEYLVANYERLSARGKGKLSKSDWYGYVYRKNHTRFAQPKLLVPSIATGSCFAADLLGDFYFVGSGGGGGGGYGISIKAGFHISYLYLLGILNSQLLSYYLRLTSTPYRGGYLALNRQYIQHLPIRGIDFDDSQDVAQHNKMVALVERMLDLQEKLAAATVPTDKKLYQRQIEATDAEIDALVYELYGLTEEEIAIVEETTK